jgi:hypothetical protein
MREMSSVPASIEPATIIVFISSSLSAHEIKEMHNNSSYNFK